MIESLLHRHIERLERRCEYIDGIALRYSRIRLAVFVLGCAAIFVARQYGDVYVWGILGSSGMAFILMGRLLRHVEQSLKRHRVWTRIKKIQLARMTQTWSQLPENPDLPVEDEHVNLGIAGPRSLYRLLNTTATLGGSRRLLALLTQAPQSSPQVARHQAIVRELIPRSIFRDRIALCAYIAGVHPSSRWNDESIHEWVRRGSPKIDGRWLVSLSGLALLNLGLFGMYVTAGGPALWLISLVVYGVLYSRVHRKLRHVFDEAYRIEQSLAPLRALLLYLQDYSFGSARHLRELCAAFGEGDGRPSSHLTRIHLVASAASIQKSEILGLIVNILLPWDLLFGYLLSRARDGISVRLLDWLDTLYKLEAACALAGFGYMYPETGFPQVVPLDSPDPVFEARQLAHPVLSQGERVANDLTIERMGDVILVTGSNMSGKSTLLRTVGTNLSLAFAGAPVVAASLRTVPFRLVSSMRTVDSIEHGLSYFRAEVRSLKSILDDLEDHNSIPLFVLIDEMFKGTNHRERLIGARAYLDALRGKSGVGIIATHDVELVDKADGTNVFNYHFRDYVEDEAMLFDFKLRPGPCTSTNALKIMHLEGLPLPPEVMDHDGGGSKAEAG